MAHTAQRHRIGIVGAGKIVEDAHLPVLLNTAGAAPAWVADVDRARVELVSRMYGVPGLALERGVLPALDDVDVCLLAIPLGARGPYIEACAKRGIAVLCEKPFAAGAAEHAAICDAFPEHALGVSLQRRHYRTIRAIAAMIADDRFGGIETVGFRMGAYDLKSGGAQTYVTNATLSGGGVLIELGIHWLDQLLVSIGGSAARVQRTEGVVLDRIDYEISADSLVETPAGPVPVSIEISRLRPLGGEFAYRFERALVRFGLEPSSPVRVEPIGGEPFDLDLAAIDGAGTVNQAFHRMWLAFLEAVDSGRPTSASAVGSLPVTRWIEAIYGALGAGRAVEPTS